MDFFFVSPCKITVPPCIFDLILHFLESLQLAFRKCILLYTSVDCLAVSVFFSLFSLQASVTVKNRGGAISNDRMVAPSHFGCKQRLLKLNHIRIP